MCISENYTYLMAVQERSRIRRTVDALLPLGCVCFDRLLAAYVRIHITFVFNSPTLSYMARDHMVESSEQNVWSSKSDTYCTVPPNDDQVT